MTQTILFLCTHNSARSQMAEGLMNHLLGNNFSAFSAGNQPSKVHPLAVQVMKEIGIDISRNRSKHVNEFNGKRIDTVVAVCDQGQTSCPFFPGANSYINQAFPDPSMAPGTDEEKVAFFRSVRDTIRTWLLETFGEKPEEKKPTNELKMSKIDFSQKGSMGFFNQGVTHLTPNEALELTTKGAVIVDLREDYETNYRVFAVPEVIYLPRSQFQQNFASLPKDKPLILADAVGLWSKEAIAILKRADYANLASLIGGIIDWEKSGLPVRKDKDYEMGGQCACKLKPRKGKNPLKDKTR